MLLPLCGVLVSPDVIGGSVSGWVQESYLEDGVLKNPPITYTALDLPTISNVQLPKVPAGTSRFGKQISKSPAGSKRSQM